MINNCKYLDTKCKHCEYMADPESCPDYEEEQTKPYYRPKCVDISSKADCVDCY